MGLAEDVRAGDRLALARLLSWLEEGDPRGEGVLTELYPQTGLGHRVGVTGPPGSGKSTLVNQAVRWCRQHGSERVAVVAVDPSSPFSGGAILGDRIRMRDLSGDPGVFIRSMASRGELGGLARRTAVFVEALIAGGYERIFIETVGAGQAEVDIARMADTTVVVEAPGMGDEIQAIKAGILEIADILVVNKADLPGAQAAVQALHYSLGLAKRPAGAWSPPILTTIAETGEGVEALMEAVNRHQDYLLSSGEGESRELARASSRLEAELRHTLTETFQRNLADGRFEAAVQAVFERRMTPAQAAADLIGERAEA
ncbi:MAG TPA: methylmalonyl Co-A mutase-associated GTPase MeaB [Anaerolineales bacterium]|nr:methylmalonyl Co-A mutase-associated GTPase MeaB [Anaerolineales bacterium]